MCRCRAGPALPRRILRRRMRRRARRARASGRLQAELGLSGRAAGQRMRGRVLAGLVPGALRLEGVAPFGAPVFILVADGERGTLLLSRDRRVVRDAAPEEILNALVGIRLGPDDLRAMLERLREGGGRTRSRLARTAPTGSRSISRRAERSICGASADAWRIVAGRYGGLEIDYPAFAGRSPVADCAAGRRSRPRARGEPGRSERRSAARSARRAEDSGRRRAVVARASCAKPGPLLADSNGTWPMRICHAPRVRQDQPVACASPGDARPDGFHEVQTILQAIDLFDRVKCEARRGPFEIRCDMPGVPTDRTNLVWKAAQLLWEAAGRAAASRATPS